MEIKIAVCVFAWMACARMIRIPAIQYGKTWSGNRGSHRVLGSVIENRRYVCTRSRQEVFDNGGGEFV